MSIPLYTIAMDYRDMAEALADLDLPPEVVADTLESMAGDLELKITSVSFCVRNMEATSEAIKAAEESMARRRKVIENRIVQIKRYALDSMLLAGVTNVNGPYLRISVRDNPDAVEILPGVLVPSEFMLAPPPRPPASPDKLAIKAAIKAGADLPFARLTQSKRLEIKA